MTLMANLKEEEKKTAHSRVRARVLKLMPIFFINLIYCMRVNYYGNKYVLFVLKKKKYIKCGLAC